VEKCYGFEPIVVAEIPDRAISSIDTFASLQRFDRV
jgi:hypothetical protein